MFIDLKRSIQFKLKFESMLINIQTDNEVKSEYNFWELSVYDTISI